MAWLLAVIFLSAVYYLRTKDKNDRIQNRNKSLEKFKASIDKYLDEKSESFQTAWHKHTNPIDRDNIINNHIQRGQIALWDRHYKTVMTSDNFSKESKAKLDTAWYIFLMYYSNTIEYGRLQGLERNEIDKQYQNSEDARETLIATLEAFGYDSDKEREELKRKITSQYKKGSK